MALSSKQTLFLTPHTVHQIQAWTIFHLFNWLEGLVSLFQHFNISDTLPGIVQLMPIKLMKIFHNWSVQLQWRKRWEIVSNSLPQRKHLEQRMKPLLVSVSWVSTTSLASNQEKHATLWGILTLQIIFQGQVPLWLFGLESTLYVAFTVNLLSLFLNHIKQSASVDVSLNCSKVLKNLASLLIFILCSPFQHKTMVAETPTLAS